MHAGHVLTGRTVLLMLVSSSSVRDRAPAVQGEPAAWQIV